MDVKTRPPLVRPRQVRRLPKSQRKQHNVCVVLNEAERDALDAQVERLDLDMSTYFRGLIWAVHNGELRIDPQLFRD